MISFSKNHVINVWKEELIYQAQKFLETNDILSQMIPLLFF